MIGNNMFHGHHAITAFGSTDVTFPILGTSQRKIPRMKRVVAWEIVDSQYLHARHQYVYVMLCLVPCTYAAKKDVKTKKFATYRV